MDVRGLQSTHQSRIEQIGIFGIYSLINFVVEVLIILLFYHFVQKLGLSLFLKWDFFLDELDNIVACLVHEVLQHVLLVVLDLILLVEVVK